MALFGKFWRFFGVKKGAEAAWSFLVILAVWRQKILAFFGQN